MLKDKQSGVLLPATLQIVSSSLFLVTVLLTLAESVYFIMEQAMFVFTFLCLGVIGIVLFYGIWTLKGWAWLASLVVNLAAIIGVILVRPDSYVKWWYWSQILSIPIGEVVLISISVIMIIYLILPRTRTLLMPPQT